MTEKYKYKQVRFKLSSWRMLRRVFYGRQNETFSDYIERIAEIFNNKYTWTVKK